MSLLRIFIKCFGLMHNESIQIDLLVSDNETVLLFGNQERVHYGMVKWLSFLHSLFPG